MRGAPGGKAPAPACRPSAPAIASQDPSGARGPLAGVAQPAPRSSNLRQTMLRSCKRWRSSREEPQVRAIVGSSVPYEDVGVRGKRQMFDLGTIKGKGVTRSVSLASLVMSLEIPAADAEISLPLTGLLLA